MYFGINRYLCDTLEDMRKCWETRNFAPIKGLIEEAQILGSRMESALSDQKDLIKLNEEVAKMRREYKTLKKEIEDLQNKKKGLSKAQKKELKKKAKESQEN